MDGGSGSYWLNQWQPDKGSTSTYVSAFQSGAHTHPLSGSVSQYTGRTGPYDSPSGYAGSGYGHDHGDTLEGGDRYDILPPYITVYFWKRTA